MKTSIDHAPLKPLEREALERAIAGVAVPQWREGLRRQIGALHVIARDYTGYGFYTDLECPPELRIADLPESFNKTPPETFATHPEVEGGIFFIVYTKEGVIRFLEAASVTTWPDSEDLITFEPPTT